MSTTTPTTIYNNDDNLERYERIQLSIIIIASICGVVAFSSIILCLKNKYSQSRIYPDNLEEEEPEQTDMSLMNYIKYKICCFDKSAQISNNRFNSPKFNSFFENLTQIYDNLFTTISLEEHNIREEINLDTNFTCVICSETVKRDNIKVILPCKHEFKKSCIVEWFRNGHNNCPICNAVIIV